MLIHVPIGLGTHLSIVNMGHIEDFVADLVVAPNHVHVAVKEGSVKPTPRQFHFPNALPAVRMRPEHFVVQI